MAFAQRNSLVLAERDRFGPPAFTLQPTSSLDVLNQPRLPAAKLAFRIPKIIWIGILLLGLATALRIATVIPNDSRLTVSAGVWTALAMDYSTGTLYRPILSATGYGGTRYFPLHILAHGSLINAGLTPLAAGYLLTFICSIALLAGVYCLLRQLEADPAWALIGAALVLAPAAMQDSITTIRGDLMPAALNIWGLVLGAIALRNGHWRWIFATAICFALAAVAKASTIFGAAALFSALILARKPSRAMVLAIVSAALALAILAAVNAWSDGRFFENLRSCATGGGGMQWLHQAPFRLTWVTADRDPVGLILLAIAIAVFTLTAAESWKELPGLALLWTAIGTGLIFLTPGIDYNHLIDLHIIAAVFIVRQLVARRIEAPMTSAALAVILIFAALYAALAMRAEDRKPLRQEYLSAVAQIEGNKPILSNNPMVPIIAGQSPVLLDDFMFRVLRQKDPSIAGDLCQRVGGKEFGVIVLTKPVQSEDMQSVFGDEFAQTLAGGYDKVGDDGTTLSVYRPRHTTSASAGGND